MQSLLVVLLAALAEGSSFTSSGNPILSDGSLYTADPAPLVVNDTLYIIAGHDAAPANQNAFVINQWAMLSSSSPDPSGGDWTLHPDVADPEDVFSWAKPGTAYAAQVVQGPDGRFYLYAPVTEANSKNEDAFAIGVAVSDSPTGPFKDAHPAGPIISQSIPSPGNSIQNIDPTVLVEDDGSVYLYFGTFGELLAYKLDSDMITIKSDVTRITSLTGYFEAPWLMKRKETYYLLFAANNAGPDSPCTPTSYHACIAYGTASNPLGPWTFQDVILPVVSSTTSHPGVANIGENWYLTYHTADAKGGGHFRRSAAFDKLTWDDTSSPAKINRIEQTFGPKEDAQPTHNIAPKAKATSENETPIQYWIAALNDGRVPETPLPPDYWSSYDGDNSPQKSTLTYTWDSAVQLNGTSMAFFADQPAGSSIGVAPPKEWYVEYQDGSEWKKVVASGDYPLEVTDTPEVVGFEVVETKSVRAVLTASGSGKYAGVGVKEWEVLSTKVVGE